MLNALKNELKQREMLAEAADLDDEILVDEMDDDILLDDEEEDTLSEDAQSEIEYALEMIPEDDSDLPEEEIDALLEATCGDCGEVEEDAKAEPQKEEEVTGDEEVAGDSLDAPMNESDINLMMEELELSEHCEEENHNIYDGDDDIVSAGACFGEDEDCEDGVCDDELMDESVEDLVLLGEYFE